MSRVVYEIVMPGVRNNDMYFCIRSTYPVKFLYYFQIDRHCFTQMFKDMIQPNFSYTVIAPGPRKSLQIMENIRLTMLIDIHITCYVVFSTSQI